MIKIDNAKCIGCGKCVGDCVAGCLQLEDGKSVCGDGCIRCGHCVAICPTAAVTIPDYEMADVEESVVQPVSAEHLLRMIKSRRSIRHYKERPIETEKLEEITQAGRYTATGSNAQGCRFVVVQNRLSEFKEIIWTGIKESLKEPGDEWIQTTMRNFLDMRENQGIDYLFRNAPAVIYVAAESTIDAGLAAQNMELVAVAHGLGMLYNGFLQYATAPNKMAREWLGIADKPIGICMLAGYPDVEYRRTAPRRSADVCWR